MDIRTYDTQQQLTHNIMPETTKNKSGTYKGNLYTATVTCEGAGVVCEESADLTIIQNGIRVHLMRPALINKTKKYPANYLKDITGNDFKELKLDGLPDIALSKYKYAGTVLQPGYIYVINEKDKNDWSEWEIDEGGHLIEISKDLIDKDQRDTTNKSVKISSYIAKPTDVLWFAYSSVQWSSPYFKKMQSDSAMREARMQKFDGPAYVDKQTQSNVFDFDAVTNSFSFYKESNLDLLQTQKKVDIAQSDKTCKKPDYELDTVLFVHDPLGILIELTSYLKYLWVRMDALMISLKTGVDINKVEQALRKGIDPKSLQNAKDLEQIEALYNIAVHINSVAFANEKNIDKIGEEIDAKRLKLILATNKRLTLKKKIAHCRSVIIDFLKGDYLDLVENDYIENCNEQIANIKEYKATLISELWQPPNFKDSFLETKEEAKKWAENTKKGKDFIKEVLQGKTSLGKVFITPSILEEVEGKANYLKYVGITNALFDIAKGIVDEGDKVLESWVEVLNKTQIKINGTLLSTTWGIQELSHDFRKSGAGRSDFSKKALNINKKTVNEFNKAVQKFTQGISELMQAKQIAFTASFEKAIVNDTLSGISKFQDSPFWTKLLRNCSFVNLGLAAVALRKSDSDFQFWLNLTKLIVAIGDAHVAVRNVQALRISDAKIDKFNATTLKRTRIVAYVTVLVDTAEAGLNYWERDYDAAIAYTASAGLALAGLLCTAGVVNVWNPVGWGCILIGAVVGFCAAFLEDSPLERIAKNGIFGEIPTSYFMDVVTFKGDYIAQIKQHVDPTVRDLMHKTGFTAWEDLPKQYEDLMDTLLAGRVNIKIENEKQISETFTIGSVMEKDFTTLSEHQITKIKINTTFGGYLNDSDQIEYLLYYLPQGLGKTAIDVTQKMKRTKVALVTKPNQIPQAHWDIDLSTLTNYTEQSQFIVLTRMNMNGSQYFPVVSKGKDRYIGAIIPIIRRNYTSGIYYNNGINNRIFVGTTNQLLSKKRWK